MTQPQELGYKNTVREPKSATPADRKDILFLLLTFVCLYLIVDFGLFSGMNLGFSIAYAALFAIATAYLTVKGCLRLVPTVCGVLSLALCPVFALYHDVLGNTAAFFAICLLFSVYIGGNTGVLFRGVRGFRMIYDCVRILFYDPFARVSAPFLGFKAARAEGRKRGNISGVILGLLACIPVLCVVIPLLVSSDAAFAAMVRMVFKSIGSTLLHLFIALLFLPLLYGVLYSLRHKLTKEPQPANPPRIFDSAIICGFLGLLSAVYLFYLFSQLTYFFSAFSSILPEEFSAADYARRGFFELCVISVINLVLMSLAFILVKRDSPAADLHKSVKGLGIFLCLFNLVLVGTAISKMALYISRFGLTRLRILTTVFMVMMGALFLCLIARLIFRRFPYMALSLILCTVIGGCVLYADVNTVIANYNVDAYLTGKLSDIDCQTLSKLGASAVPALNRLYQNADDEGLREHTLAILSDMQNKLDPSEDFRSYNYTNARALEIISNLGTSDQFYYTEKPKEIAALSSEDYRLLQRGEETGLLCKDGSGYSYEILLDGITQYHIYYGESYAAFRQADGSCYTFNTKTGVLTGPMSDLLAERYWQELTGNSVLSWYDVH